MSLPLWIRRLPHNLSTIRPAIRVSFYRLHWALGLWVYFLANKGDKDYLFHFEETGVGISLGPVEVFVGLVDTAEENAWIP